jgi:gliding motility-associated-like protein
MKYLLSLIFLICIILSADAQISVTTQTAESRCSANGQIILTTTGGTRPYTYEIIASPSGFTRPPQVNDTFRQLPPGDYTILITDNNSRTTRTSATVQGNYREPTLDSVQIQGSTARIFASGGRPKLKYTYSNNGGRNFVPFQDSSVFYCLPNADYSFRVYDSCDNFYTAYNRISVPNVYFYAVCENQTNGTTNIRNINFGGGEPPYLFTCISNFGDTITNTTGTFDSLRACNFKVIFTDKCQRQTERFFDCPPANLQLYVRCASHDRGTATVFATGGTPPYRFQEVRSSKTAADGIFTGLRTTSNDYYFTVTDTCGRVTQNIVNRITLNQVTWQGCPFDSAVRLGVYQSHREIDTCGRGCSNFLPYVFNCVNCSPPQYKVDSGQFGYVNAYYGAYFPKIGVGNHKFEVSNGCGDTLRFDVKMDTADLSVWTSTSCEGGTIQAYSSQPNTKFYLIDSVGIVIDTNATGTFRPPYFGTFTVEGRHKGCRSSRSVVAAFVNPYARVRYASCDSVSVYTCPVINGWRFFLRDSSRRIIDSNTTGNFTNLLNAAVYTIYAAHPDFKDTLSTTATTSSLPPFYPDIYRITCSSLCVYTPYGWTDQHNAPLTFILQDSLSGREIAQNRTGCFSNLLANRPYKVIVKHPYCGTKTVDVRTSPIAKPTFCLSPSVKTRNGKCEFAWRLNANAASTKLKIIGGPDSVNLSADGPNASFDNLSAGTYVLITDCTFDTIKLPKVQHHLNARSGPSCPNIASLQAFGGRSGQDWLNYGDSLGVRICSPSTDYYALYDDRGTYLATNYDGFFNYLIPANQYQIRLNGRGCELDTVKITTTFYERTDLVTSYGAICDTLGRDKGKIRAKLNGGTAPYTFEILAPAGIRSPIQTNAGSVLFDNLPAGSYTLRAYDACGISSDFTGSIGILKFTPQYKRLCNGILELEVPEIDGAKYKWSLLNSSTILDTTRLIRLIDTASKTLVVSVRTDDSCVFETRITVPSFSGSIVRAFAGNDTVAFDKNFILNADSLKRGLSGRWSQIAPSSGGTSFLNPNNPKTGIKVSQLPGLYTYVWSVFDSTGGCFTTDTLQVTFCNPTMPLSVQIQAEPSRCTIPTGKITLNVSNATTELSYKWSNGKQTNVVDSLKSGVYFVTIDDKSVCTTPLIKEIAITQPIIEQTITKKNVSCFDKPNGEISVQARGGNGNYAIAWSDNSLIFNRINLKSGLYTFTVTDTEGCLKNDTARISQPPQIIKRQADSICWGKYFQVGNFRHTTTGVYQDTLTAASGCDSLVVSQLFVRDLPEKEQNIVICYGDSLQVGAKTYTKTGFYTDTLKTSFGCDSLVKTNLRVLKLDAQIASTPQICSPNGTLEATAQSNFVNPPPQYLWDNGETMPKITNLGYGFYKITVSQLNCSVVLNAKVDSLPNAIKVGVEKNNLICPNDNSGKIALTVTGYRPPLTVLWNTNATTLALENISKGRYTYRLTDANGCRFSDMCSIVSPDSFSIKIQATPITCFGYKDGKMDIREANGGTIPYTFALNIGLDFLNVNKFDSLNKGDYTLKLKDARGCTHLKSFKISEPEALNVRIEGDNVLKLGEEIPLRTVVNSTFHAPLRFKWRSAANLSCDSCADTRAKDYADFKVFLLATDANKCFVTDSIVIRIDKTQKTYAPNAFSPNGDGSNDRFTIYGNAGLKDIKQLKIFNRWGIMVFQGQNIKPNAHLEGWDGTFLETPLNPDVFVYWAELAWWDGSISYISGNVTIVK